MENNIREYVGEIFRGAPYTGSDPKRRNGIVTACAVMMCTVSVVPLDCTGGEWNY